MATAVIDVELANGPASITGLDRYAQARLIFRWRGRPVAQAWVPITGGRLHAVELSAAARRAGGWDFWERWLHARLDWDAGRSAAASLPSATVAVCTRDRPDDLRHALDALMRLPDRGQELLVIDNRPSSDATRRIVAEYARVRYLREDAPGLNAARNRALREARGEIVAFTDDDTVPEEGWLDGLLRNFPDPAVACVTGLTLPVELETEAQEWFERHTPFSRGFRRHVFDGNLHNPLSVGRLGAGANMALRRSALERVGPFDEALDAGTPTQSGGDHEMFVRLLAAGWRLVYDPSAVSRHRHRRTREELRRTLYGYGVGVYAMWTRQLLVDRELGVLRLPWMWFRGGQLPALMRALLPRRRGVPPAFILAELRGCLAGPWAYLRSRRRLRRRPARSAAMCSPALPSGAAAAGMAAPPLGARVEERR